MSDQKPTVARHILVHGLTHRDGQPLAGIVTEVLPQQKHETHAHINVRVLHPTTPSLDWNVKLPDQEGITDHLHRFWTWPPRT
jgi:hypothetical protein